MRKAPTIGIAQNDKISAALLRRLPGRERIFRLIGVAIKTVFSIVDDKLSVVFEIPNRVADHREIFIRRGA